MWKIASLACVVALLCACKPPEKSLSDEGKIATLQKLCKESAYETFVEKSADGSVLLNEEGAVFGLSGWSISSIPTEDPNAPIGAAHLPVLDLEYAPTFLLRNLFNGKHAIREVIFDRVRPVKSSQIPIECQAPHMLSVKSKEEAEATFLHVCDAKRIVKSVDEVRYYIGQAYGEPDESDIRRFVFL